jgi:hypothetical protein
MAEKSMQSFFIKGQTFSFFIKGQTFYFFIF